jgi:hypothetical protein
MVISAGPKDRTLARQFGCSHYGRAVKIDESAAADFIITNLADRSLSAFLDQSTLAEFLRLVEARKEIAAAQEYQRVTGADLGQCHFAVHLAKRFSP